MSPTHALTAALTAVTIAASIAIAAPATATTSGPDTVIASGPLLAAPRTAATVVGVDANLADGLSITGHHGKPVTVSAPGKSPRTASAPANRPVIFRHLSPGTRYVVAIGGARVGSAVPVAAVGPAGSLVVRAGSDPGSVQLSWAHRTAAAQGAVDFAITIADADDTSTRTRPGIAPVIVRAPLMSTTIRDLDPSARYTFTVTARNSAGAAPATAATMSVPLARIPGISPLPAAPSPTPAASPTPAPAIPPSRTDPAAASTRTVYVCPAGYADIEGLCRTTTPYTFHTVTQTTPYTFHAQTSGPAPILDTYETTANSCASGYNYEDYGWVKYCRRYGTAPTVSVKDATPTGYSDTGTAWAREVAVKDALPTGYSDDGTAWVAVAAKITVQVPA
jgi:hypothetical protein